MGKEVLRSSREKHGLVLDPRTKLLLLLVMSVCVLGSAGGEKIDCLLPVFCALPGILLLTARKFLRALAYAGIYLAALTVSMWILPMTSGIINYLLLATCGVVTRFLPGIMMAAYLVSTTTVSEFTAAMLRMKMSEKIIIPLSVMFRFFPTVMDEAASISAAMRMRDVRFGGRNAGKMLEYRLVPLMTCCVKIGEELSAAALTRGLGGDVRRTNICKIGFRFVDWVVIALCVVPFVMLILEVTGIWR